MNFEQIAKDKEKAKVISLETKNKLDSIKNNIYEMFISEYGVSEDMIQRNENFITMIKLKKDRIVYLDKWLNVIVYDGTSSRWKREFSLSGFSTKPKFDEKIKKYL